MLVRLLIQASDIPKLDHLVKFRNKFSEKFLLLLYNISLVLQEGRDVLVKFLGGFLNSNLIEVRA